MTGDPVFTPAEREYLDAQRLGRLVTLQPDGSPQVRPVGFRRNAEHDTIDVGGFDLAATRKYRNVQRDPRVAFVVDDLASTDPWRPRGVEIRGSAEAASVDGRPVIRIHPHRVLGWGIDTDGLSPPSTRTVTTREPVPFETVATVEPESGDGNGSRTTPDATAPVRLARPCQNLAATERFWTEGLGLAVLGRAEPEQPGQHRLVFLGRPEAPWHLELVDDPDGETPPSPTEEDLLVLYLGAPVPDGLVDRLIAAGGARVPARNPYWDHWGVTVEDPDGYRLVLSHRTWG